MIAHSIPAELQRDLLALVDGALNDDPATAAEVRERISRVPEAERAYRDYREQNQALRAAYGDAFPGGVPERMRAVLDGDRGHPRTWKAAAAIALLSAAGVTGWVAGKSVNPSEQQTAELFAKSASRIYAADAVPAAPADGAALLARHVAWNTGRVSMTLQAPDLRDHGYFLLGSEHVTIAGNEGVRLRYAPAGSDDEAFSLFLRPRWEERSSDVRILRDRDISIAAWFDGPFAVAVTGRLRQTRVSALAESVRNAMQSQQAVKPSIQPEPAEQHEALLSDDAPTATLGGGLPVLPASESKADALTAN